MTNIFQSHKSKIVPSLSGYYTDSDSEMTSTLASLSADASTSAAAAGLMMIGGDVSPTNGGSRGPYERAWTTDATRALVHIRGSMEEKFNDSRCKRTKLWSQVAKQLYKLGYKYNSAKVQKKWHNILITYNKNLNKKYATGYVHWEFFEEMFKYLQGKRATVLTTSTVTSSSSSLNQPSTTSHVPCNNGSNGSNSSLIPQEDIPYEPDRRIKTEYAGNDIEHDDDRESSSSPMEMLPLEITHDEEKHNPHSPTQDKEYDMNGEQISPLPAMGVTGPMPLVPPPEEVNHIENWWKEYLEQKLDVEREKIDLQREMHRDMMAFNKMSLIQQEKLERIKIEAINSLTGTLQKFVEVKNRHKN